MVVAPFLALVIAALIFIVALLYSTVGHAGASGYLAAMALFGLAPAVMKPTALALNILVAIIGTVRFYRAGFFSWRTFWPFALASIPADGVSWNRFLGPSRQFDPFINFGSAFVSVLLVFLGYYHLARLGAFLGIAISALTCFTTQSMCGTHFRIPNIRSLSHVARCCLPSHMRTAQCDSFMEPHQGVQFSCSPGSSKIAAVLSMSIMIP